MNYMYSLKMSAELMYLSKYEADSSAAGRHAAKVFSRHRGFAC
jgi:hypothetical protein